MKHILVFSTAYLPLVGGAEVAIHEITKRLSKTYRFTIITYRFSRSHAARENHNGVEIIRLGTGSKIDRFFVFPFRVFWTAREIIKKESVHLLWAVMVSYAGIGAYFVKLFKPSLKFLLTLQEGDSETHFNRGKFGLIGLWWTLLIPKADHVQVISTYLKTLAERNGAKKVTVVPNGVDIEKFKNKNSKIKITNQNSKVITTTSRLVQKNAIDTLIRAVAELKDKLKTSSFKLRIVGDGPLKEELQHLTKKLNIQDIVDFAGEVAPEKIPQELASAHIFVRTSRSEGLGVSFLEAMAAGLPVIATPVGGIPDFLKDKETGLFVKVDDSVDVANKLQVLLTDRALYEKLSQAGRKLIESSYSWDRIANLMEGVYESTATA